MDTTVCADENQNTNYLVPVGDMPRLFGNWKMWGNFFPNENVSIGISLEGADGSFYRVVINNMRRKTLTLIEGTGNVATLKRVTNWNGNPIDILDRHFDGIFQDADEKELSPYGKTTVHKILREYYRLLWKTGENIVPFEQEEAA